ncbi:hypothetical protein ACFYVL_44335 [Streptomyces sp. NPDC004111]|uniref:hypothetical protein n=1 Tax=Streptomyces sp. NPDC004111 TaxID=3364690 RepID=UPI0036905A61
MALTTVTVDVPAGTRALLTDVVAAEAAREKAWLADRRAHIAAYAKKLPGPAGPDAADRAAHRTTLLSDLARMRAELRAERAALRESGELRGSQDLVVAHGVREVVEARGWADREWPAVPDTTAAGVPGRPVGTGHGRVRARPVPGVQGPHETLTIRLPADLATLVRTACHVTSQPAVEALIQWQAVWGDGPRATDDPDQDPLRPLTADGAALAERSRLRAQVITLGDVIRDAVRLVTLGELPEDAPL